MKRQRGLVLFFALVALVVMSLAAVALIRSVDTGAMIAGNLAFKQSATTAGDEGLDAAVTWLATTEASANTGQNVMTNNPAHPFNATDATRGYYANTVTTLNLYTDAAWDAITNIPEKVDNGDNHIRYIIQRMCRIAGVGVATADCLFSDPTDSGNATNVPLPQDVCTSSPSNPCPVAGQTPLLRITVRTKGPKNTVSYLQAFVY